MSERTTGTARRAMIDDLASPIPLGSLLPAIFQDLDPNVMRLTESLDSVIAPIWMALDSLDAYFDAELAPRDFVLMLARWVGLPVDDNWSDEQLRRLVGQAVELYRWRGTRRGVIALVEAFTGVRPEVDESGGTSWSADRGTTAPGSPSPSARIEVRLPAGREDDLGRLSRLIAETVPAHVLLAVDVVRSEPR